MNKSFTTCYYHPEKVADTVCDRCRRPICLDDRRIFAEDKSLNLFGYKRLNRSKSSSKKFHLCILCNGTMLRLKSKSSHDSLIFLPIIGIFFFLTGIYLSGSSNGFISIGIIGTISALLCISIFLYIYNIRSDFHKAKLDVLNLLSTAHIQSNPLSTSANFFDQKDHGINSNSASQNLKNDISNSRTIFTLGCYECGDELTLQDKFCQHCGNSTHEELMDFYRIAKSES